MNIVKLNLADGIVIKTDLVFNDDYEKAMYVNGLIEKLYSGKMKMGQLDKEQYNLIQEELGRDVMISKLYKFGSDSSALKMA